MSTSEVRPKKKIGQGWLLGKMVAFLLGALVSASVLAVEIGETAPGFTIESLNSDETVSLGDFKGKVVILDFWASWCGPCLVAMPKLSALSDELPEARAALLAVSVDTNPKRAQRFMKKMGATYDSLIDPSGEVAAMYNLPGMPTTFVIDQDGRITARLVGFKPGDELELEREVVSLYENK